MKIKIIFCFLFFSIPKIESKTSIFPKHWLSSCRINDCEASLSSCLKCTGENQCKQCISTSPDCQQCAEDIFKRDDLENIAGEDYLICDMYDQLQVLVCSVFCRGQYKQSGTCDLLNSIPVCQCSNGVSSVTPSFTTSPSQPIESVLTFNGLVKKRIDILDGFQRIFPLPDGNFLRGSNGAKIEVWDTSRGTVVKNLTSVYFNPFIFGVLSNGDVISGFWANKTLIVWNLKITNDDPLRRIIQTTESFQCLLVLRNDDLAIGQYGPNYDIVIKDSYTGFNKKRLVGHSGIVYQIISMPNGDLASCSSDKTVRIWDPISGTLIRTLIHSTPVQTISMLKNGNLASGVAEGLIKIWNLDTGDKNRIIRGHGGAICNFDCLFTLYNSNLISGSFDKTIRLWNPFDATNILIITNHKTDIRQLSFSKDGTLISSSNTEIIIWS